MAVTAYIALGSNLGDREMFLRQALARLTAAGAAARRVSSFHETAPVGGPPGQGPYLNAAAEIETESAQKDVMRLDVAMEQPCLMGFAQRATGLTQHPYDPLRRKRTETIHKRHEVHTVEQFHNKVEVARLADAEVVEPHRVRRTQMGDGLCLKAKTLGRCLPATLSEQVRPDQLDRTWARQELVSSAPHLAHAPRAKLLNQTVVTKRQAFVEEGSVNFQHGFARGVHRAFKQAL